MSLVSAIRAAVGAKPKAADNPAPEDEETKPGAEDGNPEEDKVDPAAEDDTEDRPEASDDMPDEEDEPEAGDDKEKPEAKAERQRIGAITGHAAAERLPNLAAHLAFKTGLPAKAAGSILSAAALDAGSAKPSLAERMNGKVPALGAGSEQKQANSLAARAAQRFGSKGARGAQKGESK